MRSLLFAGFASCLVTTLAMLVASAGCGSSVSNGGGGTGGQGSGSGGGGSGGADEVCTKAQAHLADCAPPGSSSSSASSSGMPPACAGAYRCQSLCINASTCAQINGLDPSFTTCLTGCQGK